MLYLHRKSFGNLRIIEFCSPIHNKLNKTIMLNNNLTKKPLTICVLAVFAMLINVSGVFAYIDPSCGFGSSSGGGGGIEPIVADGYECKGCNCDKKCLCDAKSGAQGHRKEFPVSAIDFNASFNGMQLGSYNITSVFFLDSIVLTKEEITGVGYIDVPVEIRDDIPLYNVCEICENAIQKFTNYQEWLAMCYYLADADIKVSVFPNPTSSTATIKLNECYVSSCDIIAVEYELYNSSNTLLTTLNPPNVTDDVKIPATFIATQGTYFIVCKVTSQNGTDEIKVPFTVLLQSGGGH